MHLVRDFPAMFDDTEAAARKAEEAHRNGLLHAWSKALPLVGLLVSKVACGRGTGGDRPCQIYQDKIVDHVDLYQSGAALDIDHINSILCVTFHLQCCSLALWLFIPLWQHNDV